MADHNNLTKEWGDKLAQLVAQDVTNPPPAENAVNAKLQNIDGTGVAALVSKLTQPTSKYGGFALILQDDTEYKEFEWLQFITRQLVANGVAINGNLVIKTNTTSYQLVNSVDDITDYTFANGNEPSNWDTCWKVDSIIVPVPRPFFRDSYEYAISDPHKFTAILDAPGILTGKTPTWDKSLYEDLPPNCVVMKDQLGTQQGISRAYFSDYLMKKDQNKWRVCARLDFSLTWNAQDTDKNNFTVRCISTTATTSLLDCHKAALMHKTVPGSPTKQPTEPWKTFRDSIVP
ncbi:uncharacterized protein TrAFT101_011182 [Trichoderma asperellum]|uniref:Uncharacterized protein n=1 Tax=Trichoderma asperellum (strain ATCC 204424 / CBS 433.97 / NBRC 101777) TaxID=1042311 RepID=A0A2T3YY61_TRIA4|nr:hypothetical protein M441DRAFT_61392 [Trichoderma asperellum CBS 433.97]PTB37464.1 hypothetical protein M441DRAFT_61392 [Trichoderma asperellum CBS 433.97]UKZ96391.1 hypothetical protein TrAFT101_011182 [Trichoderma asperellum]